MGSFYSKDTQIKFKRKYQKRFSYDLSIVPEYVPITNSSIQTIKEYDFKHLIHTVYNQQNLNTSVACSIAKVYEFYSFRPSVLFIYYNERCFTGNETIDSGSSVLSMFVSINNIGICPDLIWPYDTSLYTIKPDENCYYDSKLHKNILFYRLQPDLMILKHCLINNNPFIFSLDVYNDFEYGGNKGVLKSKSKKESIGYHTMICVGFNDDKKHFICLNSFGKHWGDGGYCYIDYNHMLLGELWIMFVEKN